jgi:protein TonB
MHLVIPRIPESVDRKKARGQSIHLLAEVLADGTVGEVRVEQGTHYAALDSAAVRALKASRFVPAERGGVPITQWTRTTLAIP